MKKLAIILFSISLVGCVGQRIVLQNQEGEQVHCEYSTGTAMLTGTAMRNVKMNQCVQQYESQGYTKVIVKVGSDEIYAV
jgi:hypothetical protein